MSAIRGLAWRLLGAPAFRLSPKPAYGLRARLLRLFGARVDPDARFRSSVVIERPWMLVAGPRTMFGDDVVIWGEGPVRVGARTTISQMCKVFAGASAQGVEVGDDCWVAADTLVLPGSRVERGALVGARSMVEGVVESWRVASGEPAKTRGRRYLRGVSPDESV